MEREWELKNCTSVKAILMLSIVLYHSMAVFIQGGWGPYDPASDQPFIGYIAQWFNSFHVYGFALISGYIFYYIKHEKGGYQNYLSFLGNKAKRLLVPYVFIAAVWVAPIYCYYYGAQELIKKFVLGAGPSQLWFLLMLFWVFAIFGLISRLVDKKPLIGWMIVCIAYCVGLFVPSYFCLNLGLQYLMFFEIGFVMRKCDLGNKILYKTPGLVYLAADILLFVVSKLIEGRASIIFKVLSLGCNVLLHIVGAVGAFVILQRFVNRFMKGNRVLSFFGKHSMVIYLVHQQLIYFSIGWFNGVVPSMVLVLINLVFALAASTVFSMLMHLTKPTKFLVGSK